MGPNSIMAIGFLLIGLTLLAVWALGRFFGLNKQGYQCERCGGNLFPDERRYKGVVVWTCEECLSTFETLNVPGQR